MAGCGPAGLAAALLLQRDGHRVTLYERFETPRPLGSGLMLQPSGVAVLDRLGLAETVAQRGARIDALLGIEEHGRIALDAPYAKLGVANAFGVGIHRASLFSVLYDATLAQGIEIRTGHEVVTSRSNEHGRCLVFSDDTQSDTHDLIVDASGWASRIEEGEQRGLLPFGALWASIPVTTDDPHARNLLEQRYRRASQMVGVLPIGSRAEGSSQEVAFFWSLRRDDHAQWRKRPLGDWKDEVRRLWPQVEFLLDRLSSHDDLTFARYAHRTARKAHGDRLVRIGDAWHSASPQLGQGANMALLDAWALATGLREGRSVAEGIRLTTRWRREHVALYQFVTAAFTPMFQSDLALWPWLRDRMMAPLSRLGPVARIQAQLMSGLFGWPLQSLGLDLPDYSAIASSMAARASSPAQSNSPVTRQTSCPAAS
ncbi:FAD-dependent oxidoreductase [Erythrobacter mangrovi]|uniref:FAD-dependent oxidoreductase n=1 Tax=Erythrobacter mangrovi TaxID=2739433 RepID=UPI002D7F35FC|nr:NAD(P)/FAD-dependent oxidoreductase [Erythrobacter mangrovi]